uniref:Helicase ATP-binding domain-containing protein n=1 Tax=Glutinoglossum americanum TaxID=1670608 RepID=A0A9P8IBY1_9PEZI|nr:hypothetical protein FGG08_004131 [Glutinoglossum americanum]
MQQRSFCGGLFKARLSWALPGFSPDSWFYSTCNGLEPGSAPTPGDTAGQIHLNGTNEEDTSTAEQVCFGMVSFVHCTLAQHSAFDAGIQLPVVFEHISGILLSGVDNSRIGIPEEQGLHILRGFSEEQIIDLQLLCTIESNQRAWDSKASKSKLSNPPAYVSAIVYGPLDLFEDVGKFVEECGMYLQDPRGCDRNVKYRNPHRLSGLDPDVPMTSELVQLTISHEKARNPVDLLAGLESDEFLPEADTPSALRTVLYKHQKQALSFMLRRERGWEFRIPQKDLWSIGVSPSGSRIYINNITQDTQYDAPIEFYGGILADYMGLGKTLSVISLIASDIPEQSECTQSPTSTSSACWPHVRQSPHTHTPPTLACAPEQSNGVDGPPRPIRITLLIVPSPLLPSWESQLMKHLHPGTLLWVKHHGSHKLHDLAQLHKFNIVITTFQTVSSEYRRQAIAPSIIFSASWHRVVLDEAHCIRNQNAVTTKAICAIQAASRWAMTGTPIQNRLTDFSSLLKFLRVYPYSDHRVFESHITDVWKTQGDEVAIERLKKLVKYLTLRRSRAAIELPERTDTIQYLDFSTWELVKYRQAESPIAEMLDDALSVGNRQSGMYMHALAKINTLRKFCNLGLSAPTLKADIESGLQDSKALAWGNATAQEAFENLVSLGQASCAQCCTNLDTPSHEGLSLLEDYPRARLTQCLRLICDICFQQTIEYLSAPICICEDRESCSAVAVSMSRAASSPATPITEYAMDHDGLPTKIKALLVELQNAPSEKR